MTWYYVCHATVQILERERSPQKLLSQPCITEKKKTGYAPLGKIPNLFGSLTEQICEKSEEDTENRVPLFLLKNGIFETLPLSNVTKRCEYQRDI
jgi:hypothetical protein